jgi:hypothetical protein
MTEPGDGPPRRNPIPGPGIRKVFFRPEMTDEEIQAQLDLMYGDNPPKESPLSPEPPQRKDSEQ